MNKLNWEKLVKFLFQLHEDNDIVNIISLVTREAIIENGTLYLLIISTLKLKTRIWIQLRNKKYDA